MIILNILFFVVVSVASLWLCYANVEHFNIVDACTLVGTIGSLQGISLTLWQLAKVKTATEHANEEVTKKLDALNDLFSLTAVTTSEETLKSIQTYLNGEEYVAAAISLSEVAKIMKECMARNFLSAKDSKVTDCVRDITLDINILYEKKDINTSVIRSHLATAANLLMEVSSQIKAKNYGREIQETH